ncbi:MAG TPA: Grx4 family monothiol glutaredoxin [Caulobacteraceae bacterium]
MTDASTENPALKWISDTVTEHPVVLFMKGVPEQPQCGFSATVVSILNQIDVDYVAVNVLQNDALRQGIKAFSEWPTIPQLYVKGEFVGGCDILREMYEAGELKTFLEGQGVLGQAEPQA